MNGTPSETPAAPAMSGPARIVNVLFSPGQVFASIAAKPGWVLMVVVLLAWTALASWLLAGKFDVEAIVDKQVESAERRGATLNEEQVEGMRKGTAFFMKLSPVIGTVWVAGMVFLVPLIYHGAAAAWGKSGRYPAVLSAYAHAQVPTLIRGVLTVAIAYPRDKLDPEGMARLLKSNVGAFLDPESTPKALLALLTNLDIFDLWAVALAAIALPRVTRLSQGAATAVVVGLWLVYVLIVTGLAALGAAFGG